MTWKSASPQCLVRVVQARRTGEANNFRHDGVRMDFDADGLPVNGKPEKPEKPGISEAQAELNALYARAREDAGRGKFKVALYARSRPPTVVEASMLPNQVVVCGDPGVGKSSLLHAMRCVPSLCVHSLPHAVSPLWLLRWCCTRTH